MRIDVICCLEKHFASRRLTVFRFVADKHNDFESVCFFAQFSQYVSVNRRSVVAVLAEKQCAGTRKCFISFNLHVIWSHSTANVFFFRQNPKVLSQFGMKT